MASRSDASRRQVLKLVGVSASGAALVTTVPASVRRAPSGPAQPAQPVEAKAAPVDAPAQPTREFLADLVGRRIGGYRVESVGAIERGGVPVVLASGADSFRVDVLRADPLSRPGIGVTSAFSVYLRNGGDGRTSTNELRGLGAMALARELARRTRKGEKPPAELLTMNERIALDAVS